MAEIVVDDDLKLENLIRQTGVMEDDPGLYMHLSIHYAATE